MIHTDFETASEVDLRATGVYTYAKHPSTRVLCLCWEYDDGSKHQWVIGSGVTSTLLALFKRIADGELVFAHNAEFEWVIWNLVFRRMLGSSAPVLPLQQMRCTAAMSAFWGLPRSLDDASRALNLPQQKDKAGHAHMMRMNKPRTRNKDGSAASWWHEDEPDRMIPLLDYCHQDVTVEAGIAHVTPVLPKQEQALWELNCRMNAGGVGVDVPLVDAMKATTEQELTRLNALMAQVTGGEVTTVNQVARLLKWFQEQGAPGLTSVSRETLEGVVALPGIPGQLVGAANVRLEAAKSSTAKLDRVTAVRGDGDRVRGLVEYFGAARTGRYAGRLCQPHNFPRGVLKGPEFDAAIHHFQHPMTTLPPRGVSMMEAVSSCLRGLFIPAPRRATHFAVGDFSQIEARVLAWLAGQGGVLKVFAAGEDVYTYAAQQVGSDQRQLGKVMTLALGFGMGVDKFIDTAKTYGIDLDHDTAQDLVWGWRKANDKIRTYWYDMEDRVRDVLSGKYSEVLLRGRIKIRSWDNAEGKHIALFLPSGRPLIYRDLDADRIDRRGIPRLTYTGVNQKTGKLERIETYGGKIVENIVQATARDVMAEALLRLDAADEFLPVLTVHDEVICEFHEDVINEADAEKMMHDLMTVQPTWATGLPTAAEVFTTTRYRK